MHKTPETRKELDDKKHPPFWNRLVLVLSAYGRELRARLQRRPEGHRPDHCWC